MLEFYDVIALNEDRYDLQSSRNDETHTELCDDSLYICPGKAMEGSARDSGFRGEIHLQGHHISCCRRAVLSYTMW